MKKQIAIVVDDFGEHATINAAALELARTGRISAISCMTGGPAWLRGAAALGEFERNHLDLGLHLDLTQYPLGRSAWQLADLIAMGVLRRLNRRLIRDQVERQCDAFEAAVGRPPDHVDGHQHVHQLPQVRELLVDTLYRRYNPRPWLRETRRARSVGLPADVVQMESQVKSAIRMARRHRTSTPGRTKRLPAEPSLARNSQPSCGRKGLSPPAQQMAENSGHWRSSGHPPCHARGPRRDHGDQSNRRVRSAQLICAHGPPAGDTD